MTTPYFILEVANQNGLLEERFMEVVPNSNLPRCNKIKS